MFYCPSPYRVDPDVTPTDVGDPGLSPEQARHLLPPDHLVEIRSMAERELRKTDQPLRTTIGPDGPEQVLRAVVVSCTCCGKFEVFATLTAYTEAADWADRHRKVENAKEQAWELAETEELRELQVA